MFHSARHKKGCGGAVSFRPGPCCTPTTLKKSLGDLLRSIEDAGSLLSQGQTSAHAQEEGLTCPPSG